jgi:hypothetical protein
MYLQGRYSRGNCKGFTSKTYGDRRFEVRGGSWKKHGGIMNGEKDREGGNTQNWRQKRLCNTKI